MPFGLWQCSRHISTLLLAIFHDMVRRRWKLLGRTFSVLWEFFPKLPLRLDHMLSKGERHQLKSYLGEEPFYGQEGIVLGHKISKKGIEVDKANIDVIAKLPIPPRQRIRSFLVIKAMLCTAMKLLARIVKISVLSFIKSFTSSASFGIRYPNAYR
ncbi:hypothetical protein Tco_1156300 [Tanacetum coccineum]